MDTTYVLLGYSENNCRVVFNPDGSHTALHFADNPSLRSAVDAAIPRMILEGPWLEFATDLGQVVGLTDGVEVSETDEIVYAKRIGRDVYTPFTKSRAPRPCSLVSTTLRQIAADTYELTSSWIGEANSPPFPGEANETAESKPYWTSHALVWGTQQIQTGTETTTCPW